MPGGRRTERGTVAWLCLVFLVQINYQRCVCVKVLILVLQEERALMTDNYHQ